MSASRAPRTALVLLGLLLVALTLRNTTGAPDGRIWGAPLYHAIELGAALLCWWRAATLRAERAAWTCMAIAMLVYFSGDLYWELAFGGVDADAIPYPSWADAFYLAFFPFAYLGLGLLVRARSGHIDRAQWLDGVIVALAAGGLFAAFGYDRLIDATGGETLTVAINVAYPLGDLVLLSLVVALVAVYGLRAASTWLLLAAGLLVFSIADAVYLDQAARGTYVEGGLLDVGWPLAMALFAVAAWQRPETVEARALDGPRTMVVPAVAGLCALGALVLDHYERLSTLAVVLSAASLLALVARFGLTYAANRKLLAVAGAEARTDHLTGLANRRELLAALHWMSERRWPGVVALFDLDGFKAYNDRFGHLAGDALLERLARRLGDAVGPHGRAFRIGGDEFCVILRADDAEERLRDCTAALTERGEAFAIGASHGAARMPAEAASAIAVLALVDERMYEMKGRGRASAVAQTRDVLLTAVAERKPDLGGHVDDVAELAVAVGRRLGLGDAALREIEAAAELHDVGKLAIPDAILDKPGPLDAEEWAFMHRHTIIGERILLAAPALAGVAPLVRASHERWDGGGYPDRLIGEQIPLGARIISLCDAYDAMVADRPYQAALAPADALAELRRCSGTQFDPAVVEAFAALLASRQLAPLAA